jgi:amino acid efflux transporter
MSLSASPTRKEEAAASIISGHGAAGAAPTPALRRRLGTADLATHYVASVLGAGVLILPGLAMEIAGPAAVLAWVALVGFSYLFAWVLARLSAERPDCRGLPIFVRRAFGPRWECGVAMLLATAMVGIIPVYGLAAAQALANLGAVPAGWPPAVPALAVVGTAVGLNLAGLRVGVRVQMATLALVVLALVAAVVLALPEADPARLAPFAPNGWTAVVAAAALCFFAVIGWENAAPLAEEVRDPARTLPRAVTFAVTLVGALYLVVAVGLAMTTPVGEAGDGRASPVAAMLGAALGVGGTRAGNLMALALLVVAANAWVLATSRMVYGLARQRILPAWLAGLRAGDAVPARACLLVGAANAAVLLAALAYGLGEAAVVSAVCAGFLVAYAVAMAAAARLLGRKRERVMAAVALAVILVMAAFHAAATALAGLALAAIVATHGLRASGRAGQPRLAFAAVRAPARPAAVVGARH